MTKFAIEETGRSAFGYRVKSTMGGIITEVTDKGDHRRFDSRELAEEFRQKLPRGGEGFAVVED